MSEEGKRGFLAEVQHRRVFRVAALYVVTAWVVLQVGDVIVEPLDLPEWTQRLVVTLAMLGFPIVVLLAWLFDVTPGGVVRTEPAAAGRTDGRGLDILLVVVALALVGFSVLRERTVAPAVIESPPAIDAERISARSIAVLPFDNLSPLEENAFFAAGIHEDILSHLSRIEALTVISRTSVLRYDETDLPLTQIAAELRVANVLEGSVRRAGNRVRISVQLIEADTDRHLWAQTYDRDLTDVFAIQTEIAENVAAAMEVELTGSAADRLADAPTRNLEAYDLYLKARQREQTVDSISQAIEYNRQAITLDPSFGLAWADIAMASMQLINRRGYAPDLVEQGYEAAEHAFELAPQEAIPHLAMAGLLLNPGGERRWDEAERHLRTAIGLDPNLAGARGFYALILEQQGRWSESVAQRRYAATLEPNDPLSRLSFARALAQSGDPPGARAALDDAFALAPDDANIAHLAAQILRTLNDAYGAIVQWTRSHRLDPERPEVMGWIGWDFLALGDFETADHWLRMAETAAADHESVNVFRGAWYRAEQRYDAQLEFARDWYGRTSAREAIRVHATALSALAAVAASEEDATRQLELLEQSGAKFREYLEPDKNNGAYRIRLPNIWGVSGLATVMSDLDDANANDLHRRLARISADPLSWVPWLHAALAEAYLGNPEAAIVKLEAARQRGFNKLWILDEYERNPHLDTVKNNIGWLEVRERIRVFNEQTLARLRADLPEAFPPPA